MTAGKQWWMRQCYAQGIAVAVKCITGCSPWVNYAAETLVGFKWEDGYILSRSLVDCVTNTQIGKYIHTLVHPSRLFRGLNSPNLPVLHFKGFFRVPFPPPKDSRNTCNSQQVRRTFIIRCPQPTFKKKKKKRCWNFLQLWKDMLTLITFAPHPGLCAWKKPVCSWTCRAKWPIISSQPMNGRDTLLPF